MYIYYRLIVTLIKYISGINFFTYYDYLTFGKWIIYQFFVYYDWLNISISS